MSDMRYKVTGLGLWMAGIENVDAWSRGLRSEEAAKPKGHGLDKRNRRRASSHARALADVYFEALSQAGADAATVSTVFGSALGEAATMIKLLEQIHRERTAPSPMAFAMSVHNAASGLVSIGGGNRGFTTSVAADYDTPAMALVEAIGLMARFDGPVVVAVADENAPRALVPEDELFDAVAAAVCVEPLTSATPALATLSVPTLGTPALPPADIGDLCGRSPVAGMVDLVDAVRRGLVGSVRLDRGRGRGWCIELCDG